MMNQRLRLADADGKILLDTAFSSPQGKFSPAERNNAISIQSAGRTVGYLLAEGGMGFNQRDEQFLVNRLTGAAWTASLAAGALSLLFSLLLAYSLMRPVKTLTQAAHKLGDGDLTQRVPVKGNDELAVLARSFNQMADSLEQAEQMRRSMTADIAHELRNPLAVQRANLEALQDGVYPLKPEVLTPLLEQNILLTRLVEDLRTLALVDAGQLRLECTEVDLAQLIQRVVDRFQPQADQRQVVLNLTQLANNTLMIEVDPIRVEQILTNLLSNALRHTPVGGQILIHCQRSASQARVQIWDSGGGIPENALPRIFDRFYRADKSRSREEGGTGLGLAIARQLTEAHGGTLSAENHPQGGALFTLHLPLKETRPK